MASRRSPLGLPQPYYATGNHEAACSQYSDLKIGLEAAGVIVLEDEAVSLERNGEGQSGNG